MNRKLCIHESTSDVSKLQIVLLKTGISLEKVEVGVFDETVEGTLALWGVQTACATNWEPYRTGELCLSAASHSAGSCIDVKLVKSCS